ncbi:PLP-dependent aminotransferase family protein [Streptomyces sp. CA-294286]|uniref:aminotransferase-like domain-containing protein n=1 Tax=Streptomyces sp. CA-294286 TaxID=3240070 RepID=UPI003D94B7AD
MREAARSGRLAPGTRLPSSRTLAADLGIARNTVADAYAELVAEGWLTARQGSGTRVAERAAPATPRRPTGRTRTGHAAAHGQAGHAQADHGQAGHAQADHGQAGRTQADHAQTGRRQTGAPRTGRPQAGPARTGPVQAAPAPAGHRPPAGRARPPARTAPAYSLLPGSPELSSFPRAEWVKAYRKALSAAPYEAFGYGDPRGRPELRAVLAEYLARARGVHADPERIVIRSGYVNALTFLAGALRRRSPGTKAVAVEEYGLDFHRECFRAAGLRIPPIGVDELGARTETLAELGGGVGAVLLTAAHQFPTGAALHPDRRAAAVDWARSTGALILEDDYDGEFRYDRQPVGALQGLDPERVVYLGTSSKALAPGLRLSWAVLPEDCLGLLSPHDNTSSALEQLALAEFIASGAYDRHIRSARLRYRRRRDDLVAALARHAPHVTVSGIAAGLNAILELPPGTERSVVRAAHWQGLAVEGLSGFRHPQAPGEGRDGLMVGYATPTDSAWAGTLETLIRALP